MSQPPSGPDQYRPENRPDPNRPQDIRPQDAPRDFPTYGRPQPPAQPSYQHPSPYQQPQQRSPHQQQSPYQQPQPQSQYQPHGSPQQPTPQSSPYGQQPSPYAQPGPQYGQQAPRSPYEQAAYPQPYSQYPQAYGYGYPGALQDKTNALAIAALITGLAGLFFGITAPIAIGLGIAALVQIKKRRESGTGQAVAGLVIGSLVTAGWAILLVIVFAIDQTSTGDEYYGAPPPTSSVPSTHVDELVVGECFNEVGNEDRVEREVCLEPHEAELFAIETLAARPWPGDSAVVKSAEAACDEAFLPYVGIAVTESRLDTDFWYPDSDSWEHGDRKVLCIALGPDGEDLDGSVRGTKR